MLGRESLQARQPQEGGRALGAAVLQAVWRLPCPVLGTLRALLPRGGLEAWLQSISICPQQARLLCSFSAAKWRRLRVPAPSRGKPYQATGRKPEERFSCQSLTRKPQSSSRRPIAGDISLGSVSAISTDRVHRQGPLMVAPSKGGSRLLISSLQCLGGGDHKVCACLTHLAQVWMPP